MRAATGFDVKSGMRPSFAFAHAFTSSTLFALACARRLNERIRIGSTIVRTRLTSRIFTSETVPSWIVPMIGSAMKLVCATSTSKSRM